MKSCIESDELSHNEAMFVADIYQINDLVQENVKDLVLMCARRLSKDGAKVLVEAQKQKLLENIHPCYEILAKLITFDEQNEQSEGESYEEILARGFDTVMNSCPDVSGPAALMLCTCLKNKPVKACENAALITTCVQACFGNLHLRQYSGVVGFLMEQLPRVYKALNGDDDRQKPFVSLLLSQALTTVQSSVLARNSNLLALLDVIKTLKHTELITLCCYIQNPSIKVQAEEIRITALKLLVTMALAALHTVSLDGKLPEDKVLRQEYDEFTYLTPKQSELQKPAMFFVQSLSGRAVLTFKLQLKEDHRVALLQSVQILAYVYQGIQLYEPVLRPDIIKYCLLTAVPEIQDVAASCLYQLYLIAPKKEQFVHSLLNILFNSQDGKPTELNAQLGTELQCKILGLL